MKPFMLLVVGMALSIELFSVEVRSESLRSVFKANRQKLLVLNTNLKNRGAAQSAKWFGTFLRKIEEKAVVSDAAEMVLSSPQLAGIKMVAEQVGFDIDAMVEKHGPAGALQGFTQLLAMLGIKLPDVLGALTSGEGIGSLLSGAPQTSGGKNPYLQG